MKTNNTTKSGAFTSPKPLQKANPVSGTLGKRRYSNDDGFGGPSTAEDALNQSSSGSGIFDWNKIDWNKGLDSITGLISNIWGNSDKYTSQALQQINKQQSTTMTILWVVIGLMAALGVFLLIRKTK